MLQQEDVVGARSITRWTEGGCALVAVVLSGETVRMEETGTTDLHPEETDSTGKLPARKERFLAVNTGQEMDTPYQNDNNNNNPVKSTLTMQVASEH